MKRLSFILILLYLFSLPLFAQYNEKQILTQQASQYQLQRQYDRAETIYLEILDKYPNDLGTLLQLMQMFLNTDNAPKGNALLEKYQRVYAQSTYMEFKIQLLLLEAKEKLAKEESYRYLQLYGDAAHKYRLIAGFFERRRFYEGALEFYQAARARFGGELYSLEMANAALNIHRFPEALTEYLNYLSGSGGVNYYVKNQVLSIIQNDESLLPILRAKADSGPNDIYKELYASALVEAKRYKEAFEIYKELPLSYMRSFAFEQNKSGNYSLALQAFDFLAQKTEQELQKLDYGYIICQIYFEMAEYEVCADKLNQLLSHPYWEQKPNNKRSTLYLQLRRLKADNDMALGVSIAELIAWLNDTLKYAGKANDIQEIKLAIAKISLLDQRYTEAQNALSGITLGHYQKDKDYYLYLLKFFQNQIAEADSLMHRYLLMHPDSDNANDIINLNMIAVNLSDKQLASFTESLRRLMLYDRGGLASLKSLFAETKDEEILIMAVEWAMHLGDLQSAQTLLAHNFEDELLKDYARLLSLAFAPDKDERKAQAREYLKKKPNSIFSPKFRQMLLEPVSSQPTL